MGALTQLCKYREGAGFLFRFESLENGVDGAIHAFYIHKANHQLSTAAHLHEAALDQVRGAQFAPQVAGKNEERK